MIQRKKNLAGYTDEQGRFRPIRSPRYVGTSQRPAKAKDRKKYSRAKAGDLGRRRQMFAREDVFDRAIRKQKEEDARWEREKARVLREIDRDVYGGDSTRNKGRGETLLQFVRSSGGIRRHARFGGSKYRGKKSYWDAGEINRLSYKETGVRGLTTDDPKGKYLDTMFQRAREAGYDVADMWDLISRVEDEAAGGKPTFATHGYLDYRDNPAGSDLYVAQLGAGSFGVFLKTYLLKKFKTKVAAQNYMRSIRSRTKGNPSRSDTVLAAEWKRLQTVTRQLRSRIKNALTKRNPVGWFRDVSPVTAEAIKKLYKTLARKYHPDKGGDLRTMQEINADYDKAMKIAAANEGNEKRAEAEREAAKPLREAIEFAVTLPDDVDVVIRGLWLWLQGNTYASRERIKSFVASDGKRFKWASQKKAWFFAAVPSSNKRGEMSFEDIDRLHGRELVNERKRRLALNPVRMNYKLAMAAAKDAGDRSMRKAGRRKWSQADRNVAVREFNRLMPSYAKSNPAELHPVVLLATSLSGVNTALQIREQIKMKKISRRKTSKGRKRNGTTTAKRRKPASAEQHKAASKRFNELLKEIRDYPSRDVVGSAMSLAGYMNTPASKVRARILAAIKAGAKKHPTASGAKLLQNPTAATLARCRKLIAEDKRATRKQIREIPITYHRRVANGKAAASANSPVKPAKRNGIVSRYLGQRKAKKEYGRELRLQAALDRSRKRRKKAEARAANPATPTKQDWIDLLTVKRKALLAFKKKYPERAKSLQFKDELAATSKRLRALKGRNKRNPVQRRRTYEMFQGRKATTARAMPVSHFYAGKNLDTLGDLVEIKLHSGRLLKFNPSRAKLCAAGGKLIIAGDQARIAKPNPAGLSNGIDAIDAIDHVVYRTYKPHHGDRPGTHYIHKLGEETGHMPLLCADKQGFAVIRGGKYKIEARGIVN